MTLLVIIYVLIYKLINKYLIIYTILTSSNHNKQKEKCMKYLFPKVICHKTLPITKMLFQIYTNTKIH